MNRWTKIILVTTICTITAMFLVTGDIPFTLFTGWIPFLGRVGPQINADPWTVYTGIVCLVISFIGFHLFARWLSPPMSGLKWRLRWTLCWVAMIVLLFAAGTAIVGTMHQAAWLATTKEPLFKRTGVAYQRSASSNNLKQMGLGFQQWDGQPDGGIPRSTFSPSGVPLHSWQTHLLPYVDEVKLYGKMRFKHSWNHPDNAEAIKNEVRNYIHPGADRHGHLEYGISHYSANVLIVNSEKYRLLTDFPEGAANVILCGEAVKNPKAWADPLNWRDPRLGTNHPNGFNAPSGQKNPQFVMGDGRVQSFDAEGLQKLLTEGVRD